MNTLTVVCRARALRCTYFAGDQHEPAWTRTEEESASDGAPQFEAPRPASLVRRACASLLETRGPDVIGVRVVHGGEALDQPVRVTPTVLANLQDACAQAPLHVPVAIDVARACGAVFPQADVWLVPETGLFCRLPLREQLYGLDAATRRALGARRFGFHGLFHQGACELVARARRRGGRLRPARILSLCLDSQPEMAAIRGRRPLMVTSGSTPLEGLPGETSCGELDPGIVLGLARSFAVGPEQLDRLLCRDSGLGALAGAPLSTGEVLEGQSVGARRARDVLEYRMLLAGGAAIAALGGLDALVLSGRHAQAGLETAARLRAQLERAMGLQTHSIEVHCLADSLDRVLADAVARAAALSRRAPDCARQNPY